VSVIVAARDENFDMKLFGFEPQDLPSERVSADKALTRSDNAVMWAREEKFCNGISCSARCSAISRINC
jgi:hypothetical protein